MVNAVEEAIREAADTTPGGTLIGLHVIAVWTAISWVCCNSLETSLGQHQIVVSPCAAASDTANMKPSHLESWLEGAGLRLPTPAAKDLQSLTAAAADSKRLKKQLEALREAELELAAREAEETAENFAVLVSLLNFILAAMRR